ncbi:hypothetical protein ACFWPK_04445 [Nocardia sp. NPDC058519]|uniref:hypothetical protein n=1 Tax=Nocardia sp. NPDC058519 TaxID=3346535 RepID=UPI0036635AD3
MKSKIARKLRDLADRIDPSTGPRALGAYWNHSRNGFVFTMTDGIRVHPPVPGCPLWYMAEDYDRSFEGMQ